MDLGLQGKRALVLGSSRGLGQGIATALAAEGAHVLLTGRSEERLEETAAAIRGAGGRADVVVCDLSDDDAVDRLSEAVVRELGGADILVNNTGGPPPGSMVDADLSGLTRHFEVMVARVISLTARLLPHMRAQGWGRVITIGSSGVIQPIPTLALSNVIRASLVGWSKSLAADVASEGITVNMLLPGRIHTERVDSLDAAAAERTGKDLEAVRAASRATIPAGRYGRVEEFAAVATFLASVPAGYVTGSQVRCDGGLIRSV